jgi:hypothetical protein
MNRIKGIKVMMTRDEMIELKAVVRRAMEEQMEMYSEVWLTGDELVNTFGTFTKSWLKRYGHSLPRKQPRVTDENGEKHESSWLYPRNKIQRMFASGEIENLLCRAVVC